MAKLLRRLRGALGMGVVWAVAWALAGVFIGLLWGIPGISMEWFVDVFDAPLPALAVPGFVSGAVFSGVLGVAGRRKRFDELSLPLFTLWGGIGGLLLSMVPLIGAENLSSRAAAVVVGTLTVLSAGSAFGTLLLARKAEDRELLGASGEVAEVGLAQEEVRDLLGGGS